MDFGMSSGNAYEQAISAVVDMSAAIFGQVASNKSIRDLSINHDDVVVESTHVDSQQLVIGIAALVLFTYSIYLVLK